MYHHQVNQEERSLKEICESIQESKRKLDLVFQERLVRRPQSAHADADKQRVGLRVKIQQLEEEKAAADADINGVYARSRGRYDDLRSIDELARSSRPTSSPSQRTVKEFDGTAARLRNQLRESKSSGALTIRPSRSSHENINNILERPQFQSLDQAEAEPTGPQPPPTSSKNINNLSDSDNRPYYNPCNDWSHRFTPRAKLPSTQHCVAKGCSKRIAHHDFESGGQKRVYSIHCQDHTCQASWTRQSGFCKECRDPENKYCRLHGRCREPGCTRVSLGHEEGPPWPWLCPIHLDMSWFRAEFGPSAVRELDNLTGEGASDFQQPGTNDTVSYQESATVSAIKKARSAAAERMIADQKRDEKDTNVGRDIMPALTTWWVIRARCSYVPSHASMWGMGFSNREVFFATRKDDSVSYEVHTPTQKKDIGQYEMYSPPRPQHSRLVPIASFDILLSGSCENGVVPWDDLELYYAMIYEDFNTAHQLLRHHPELANDTRQELTPIQFAAGIAPAVGSVDFVLLLIINGADTNSVLKDFGKTVLTFALENGRYESAITLRAFGAGSWDQGWRAEHHEPNTSHLPSREEMNRILAEWTPRNTLSLNEVNRDSLSPFAHNSGYDFAGMLIWGLNSGNSNVVDYVLQLCDVRPTAYSVSLLKVTTHKGWTPLHYAVETNQGETVEKLIGRGAHVDVLTNCERWTPLLLAAAYGRQSSVKALLECGANMFARTPAGETAFKLAQDAGHQEALDILVHYHRQLSAICDEVENVQVLPAAAPGNHDDGKIFGSSPVTSQHTTTETLETESDAEGRSQPPSSAKQDGQAAIAEKEFSTRDSDDGGFDGSIFSSSVTGSHFTSSKVFDRLISTLQSQNFNFKEDDKRVKIAILDTGIDLMHRDWQHGRIVRFNQSGEPTREEKEPRQWIRFMNFKNFCHPGKAETERDVMDLHGHGTQVAGIILRLAPRAEIYVARVCEGDNNGSISTTGSKAPDAPRGIRPGAVVEAIDWAIAQGVHLINMSIGFSHTHAEVEAALERAQAAKIVTFAAMCNDGNNHQYGAAWPARHPALTIGIHSCKDDLGMDRSGFTPPPVRNSDNFMAVGEGIITHWPESNGGGFRMAEGTSFATPVVTAMAARILAFVMQTACKKQRLEAEKEFGESLILKTGKMAAVLQKVSNRAGDYHYIHPELLWKDFNPRVKGVQDTPETRRNHAWEVIRSALV